MIADSADIRFECHKCGQRLVVESAAAGLTADCPICNTNVTVPKAGTESGEAERHGVASDGEVVTTFVDPSPDTLRDELIDASLLNGKLLADLNAVREEAGRLQQQLRELGEEHERLNATATHAQRELKTFQTERQQLKNEAATLRQRVASAEEQIAAQAAELQELQAELEERRRELSDSIVAFDNTREQLAAEANGHAVVQALLAETQERHATAERDLNGTLGRLAEQEQAMAKARERIAGLEQERTDLQARLEDAGQRLIAAAEQAKKLEETEAQLRGEREKLQASETANRELKERVEKLREEGEVLRKDLKETASGREIVEIRDLLAASNAERDRFSARVAELEADLSKSNSTADTFRTERDEARAAYAAAREEVTTLKDSPAIRDNEVLRGIVARVNTELAQRTGEVTRMKRAQYGLKLAYTIFGIGLLAVVAFALAVLPKLVKF